MTYVIYRNLQFSPFHTGQECTRNPSAVHVMLNLVTYYIPNVTQSYLPFNVDVDILCKQKKNYSPK